MSMIATGASRRAPCRALASRFGLGLDLPLPLRLRLGLRLPLQLRLAMMLAMSLAAAGCERVTHDMAAQPRYDAARATPFFPDGQSTRPPPAGALAYSRGDAAAVSGGRDTRREDASEMAANADRDEAGAAAGAASDPAAGPGATTSAGLDAAAPAAHAALAERGRERYTIFCLPCHGPDGGGGGEVVRRGFPAPPSLRSGAVHDAATTRLEDIVANGIGRMYPFADRIDRADRRAIVAYLRTLPRDPAGALSAAAANAGADSRPGPSVAAKTGASLAAPATSSFAAASASSFTAASVAAPAPSFTAASRPSSAAVSMSSSAAMPTPSLAAVSMPSPASSFAAASAPSLQATSASSLDAVGAGRTSPGAAASGDTR